jgi:beta-lactamase regulating signal transducer with metallopeptidase domain
MMNLLSLGLTVPVLLYLASVAAASLVVAGSGLAIVAICRRSPLPLRHALLVGALAVTLASPLLLAAMWGGGVTMFRLESAQEPMPTGTNNFILVGDTLALQKPMTLAAETLTVAPASEPDAAAPPERLGVLNVVPQVVEGRESLSCLDAARVAVVAWAIGCAIALASLVSGLVRVRRLMRSCQRLADAGLDRLMSEATRSLGMRSVPTLVASQQIDAPLSLGILRPIVVVPTAAIDSLTREQMRGLLTHELAHVARRDHLVGLVQRAALVLFWWNPLVHRVSGNIATLREEICDDLATHREPSGDDYAAMLVELASRAVLRRSLPTTIGMFDGSRREFSRRVERLLEDGRARVTSLDGRMKLASGAACLLLLAVACLASVQLQAEAADSKATEVTTDDTPAVEWPQALRGQIRDEQGKPVAGAKVRLDLDKIHEFKIGRWDETLVSQEMTTGADGEYRFDTASFPEMKHRPFCLMMSVTADGFADAKIWNWYSNRDTKLGEKWLDVKLVAGRVVRGRVMTDFGVPVAGAVIKAAGDFEEYWRGWSWEPRKTDEDGYFTISVPLELEGPIELWAVSRDWAPQRVVLPKSGTEMADIRLQQGAPVAGRVTREDGTPVVGVVVKAESVDDGTFNGISFPVSIATKTDGDGRYKLPPLAGIYKMYLSQAVESDDRVLGRFIVANGPVPLAAPMKVAVSGREPQTVDFRAGPGVTVSGTVRWADGRPVADCEAKASYLPPDFGSGIWIDMAHTDKNGRYELRLPKPIEHVSIHVSGENDAKNVWRSAKPTDDAPAKQKSEQFAELHPLDADLAGLDWVLESDEEIAEPPPVPPAMNDPAAAELDKLQRRYQLREQERQEAIDAAQTAEEKSRLQAELDPRVLLADDYLALEEQNRGTNVGLAALYKLDGMAASVGDMFPKLSAARIELYRRLAAHYVTHPDLDLMFRRTSAGPRIAEVPELFGRAAAENPFPSVKAAAIYQLACYHADLADSVEIVPLLIEELRVGAQSQAPGRMEALLQAKESLRDVDPVASRQQAIQLAKRVQQEFADVREPERVFQFNGMFQRQQGAAIAGVDQQPTYGQLANGLLFDLERLQVGMPAPDIVTGDGGMREHQTQYLGKVTVLVFDYSLRSFNGVQDQSIAEWAKQQTGRPLDVLFVRGRLRGDTSEAMPQPAPPLRVLEEAENGPVAPEWGIRRRPSIFVVDREGTIRARNLNIMPTAFVGELLESAAPN